MESTWVDTFEPKQYPALTKNIIVDAAIIGGGITGTTAAYFLAKAGVKVALIDKGHLADSVTAYTTAFVRYIMDSRLTELTELFGETKAKGVWRSSQEAVAMVSKNVATEKIDCEYTQVPFYKYANTVEEWKELEEDVKLAHNYGFSLEKKKDSGIKPKNVGYFLVKDQAKFHPLNYLNALRAKAVEAGALIFEGTEAKEVSGVDPVVIKTKKGRISAQSVLIATYDPFNKPKELFAHKGIYTTYVLEMQVPHGVIPEALYEDGENPYHFLRVDPGTDGYDRVILGGEDHRHELPFDPQKAYTALEQYFERILPGVRYDITRSWSGPIIETIDGLPYIGTYDEKNPHLFVATGFSGSGMTFGTLAGHMFSEFAQGRPVPWHDLYDPRRRTTVHQFWEKGKDYVDEFMSAYAKNIFKSPDDDLPD